MSLKSIFRTFRPYLIDGKFRAVPAFECGGVQYYMYDNQAEMPTGRAFASLMIYNEMEMRCTREYLELHCKAMDNILGRERIRIQDIVQLHQNLKERLDLMVMPDFVYKLASVTFFDKTENPQGYDLAYNEKKIESWKRDGKTLDFFLTLPILDMIPSLKAQQGSLPMYLGIAEQIDKIHRLHLLDVLSENP